MKLFSGICIALAGSTAARSGGYNNELYRQEQNQGQYRNVQYQNEENRDEFNRNEPNQRSFGQPASRQFQQCEGFERCNTICDQRSAQNRSFDSKSCIRQCFQENVWCDPEIQATVDAMASSLRSGAQQNRYRNNGQPNQCMQQCQQQCQPRQQRPFNPQPGNQPREREIENGPGRGGHQWGGQQRGQKLVVNIARGAHSSGGPIHVFVDDKFAGSLKSNDNVAHGGQQYELDLPPATGPGMIKLQASNSNGVHIGRIQFDGQTVVSNIWMDEDKDPKYQYCPCDRYDRQCTDSQHFRAIQFSDQTKQITGAVCAQTGNGQQRPRQQRPRPGGWGQPGQGQGGPQRGGQNDWGQGGQGNGYQQGPQGGSYGQGNQPQYGQNGPRTGGQGSYGPNGRPNFGNKNANRLG